jgi:hypothetical protein
MKDSPKYFFGSAQQALGHYFGWGGGNDTKIDIQIVGVVKDAKHRTVRGDVDRTVFKPYLQNAGPDAMTFYVRTAQPPQNAQSNIRAAMQALDSKLVLDSFVTMEEQIDNSLSVERMIALLATSFAGLALFMAAVGLYGVLAYSTCAAHARNWRSHGSRRKPDVGSADDPDGSCVAGRSGES